MHNYYCDNNYYYCVDIVLCNLAGAMENMNVCDTRNMMKFLADSKENGWQVLLRRVGNGTIWCETVFCAMTWYGIHTLGCLYR